ncbi:MAG: hypothetical protein JWM56_1250, partial [Candidatus Peribacteria bacterium]|nr:hypothetical protein [Candidatus Peribacteria bacterium]
MATTHPLEYYREDTVPISANGSILRLQKAASLWNVQVHDLLSENSPVDTRAKKEIILEGIADSHGVIIQTNVRKWYDLPADQYEELCHVLQGNGVNMILAPKIQDEKDAFENEAFFDNALAADGYKIGQDHGPDEDDRIIMPAQTGNAPALPRLVLDHHGNGISRFKQRSACEQLCDRLAKGSMRPFVQNGVLHVNLFLKNMDEDGIMCWKLLEIYKESIDKQRVAGGVESVTDEYLAIIEKQFAKGGKIHNLVLQESHMDVFGGGAKDISDEMRSVL